MDRVWNRVWNGVRRASAARAAGAVYVPDRIATAAERRYFDSLVSPDGVRHDPNVVLAAG